VMRHVPGLGIGVTSHCRVSGVGCPSGAIPWS
jgi:hypothetical protein